MRKIHTVLNMLKNQLSQKYRLTITSICIGYDQSSIQRWIDETINLKYLARKQI